MSRPPTPLSERFWWHVERRDPDECWEWSGARVTGYGSIHVGKRSTVAHRVAYELLVGPIPEGLTLDHLCRNRACVNPKHLEPVTNRVNILRGIAPTAVHARKTRCPRGHPYSGVSNQGRRMCKVCRHARDLARKDGGR